MLSKFQTESARVKGLAFHSKRPWILASLLDGSIQLWDYHQKVMIYRFDGEHERHEGPVRGIDFHRHQPLFVSGGDDKNIKVWNYKSRRCVFTLTGHSDYIRTTFFHHEYPWILSASDDQTIRIWNWQSRTSISVLSGHNHYVMCAQFHPTQDLIVSAAVDQTIRIWDFSVLRKKNVSFGSESSSVKHGPAGGVISSINITSGPELLSHTDPIVKHILDGHNAEVNWVAFHPNPDKYPLIVSAADDNHVKVWRYSSERCWEIDTCRGHYNNVTCALFHPRKDLILSISEDRSIRVWSLKNRIALDTHRRENDRFWILTAHPTQNLFAAGHDSGMLLFKLERERPPFTVHYDRKTRTATIYYVRENQVYKTIVGTDLNKKSEHVLGLNYEREGPEVGRPIHSIHYNPLSEHPCLLVTVRPSISKDVEKSTYALHWIGENVPKAKNVPGMNAVFVGRNHFVVLDKSRRLNLRSIKDGVNKEAKFNYEVGQCDEIFNAGSGRLFIKRPDGLVLFDTVQGVEKARIKIMGVKFVVQNHDQTFLALVDKQQIVICNSDLQQKCIVKESMNIKSAAWDENNVLIYTTPVQIKYTLVNGDNGTIRTIDRTVYVAAVLHDVVYCFDRECKMRILTFDPTDYKFKQALVQRDHAEILRIIKNAKLIGQAPIAYLQRKGYPEIALHFVEDHAVRFQLALECGNIEEALKSAQKLNDKNLWERLADASMRCGNQLTAAICYEKMGRYDRLAMLYFVTGQLDRVRDQMYGARKRRDFSLACQLSLMLADYEEYCEILISCNQLPLAYAVALKYQFYELAQSIYDQLNDIQRSNLPPLPNLSNQIGANELPIAPPSPAALALKKMRPIRDNWPLLKVSRGFFDAALAGTSIDLANGNSANCGAAELLPDEDDVNEADAWGDPGLDDDNANDDFDARDSKCDQDGVDEVGEWYDGQLDDFELETSDKLDADLENGDDYQCHPDQTGVSKTRRIDGPFVAPSHGLSPQTSWCDSLYAVDHVLAGDFRGALGLLNEDYGVVRAHEFKTIFMELFSRSQFKYRAINYMPSLVCCPTRSPNRPLGHFRMDELTRKLKECYALTNGGPDKFGEAIERFQDLLLRCLFYIPNDQKTGEQQEEAQRIINICREYILGLMCEVERRKLAPSAQTVPESYEDRKRSCELVSYFTNCELSPSHRILALGLALTVFAKSKEFTKTKAAFSVARRLLESGTTIKPQLKANAEKLKALYDLSVDQQNKLDYDEHNPYVLCSTELRPIYQGRAKLTCPLCSASTLPAYKGCICQVCRVARIV